MTHRDRTRSTPARSRRADRVLALVQAGGQGSRMDVLTRERAKPALPFAGGFHLIDFALSSLAAAEIADVWVGVQYQAGSLDPYLAGGRPWDLDRTRGGFRRVVPEQGAGSRAETGFSRGNADNLLRLADQIEQFGPDQLVVMSADHVFSADLSAVLDLHRERGAECTLVTAQVSKREASQNAVVTVNNRGRVTGFDYKPAKPQGTTVATEIFVYDTAVLLQVLGELRVWLSAAAAGDEDGADSEADSGLGDFGEHLLPAFVRRGKVFALDIGGYWQDVGRPEAYLAAHRDLIAGRIDVFDRPDRPVLTSAPHRLPARITAGATVVDTQIGAGCRISGEVTNSVLGSDVIVHRGATVRNAVLFDGVEVHPGASVDTAILDERVQVLGRASVGGPSGRRTPRDDEIVLIGRDSIVGRGVAIGAGARLEPGTTA
ncbi:MAG: sugar phosphate nucleotidyltransferase [Nakamurella sp.]